MNGGSLSEAVREEINSYPHIKTALSHGIVNYSALARKFMDALAKKTGKTLNEESVIVAIKRYADELDEETLDKSYIDMFAEAEITLQDNMVYTHFKKNPRVMERLEKLISHEDWKVGEMRILIQGAEQVMLIAKKQRVEETISALSDDVILSLNNNALLTFRLPVHSYNVYGVIAEITKQLARKGISIEMVTTPPDLHFLVDEKDAERTYATLKQLINDSKKNTEKK